MTCGIYTITNKVNGKRYVGSSVNIERRWSFHVYWLVRGVHHNPHLQAAWNKYSKSKFDFVVLQECLSNELLDVEQVYLDERPDYNVAISAKSPNRGLHLSKEAKNKISIARLGHEVSEATRQKIKAGLTGNQNGLGYKHTDEEKRKMSRAQLGNKKGLGYKHTAEALGKIGAANSGRKRSNKSKTKMSESAKKAWERRHAEAG